MRPDEYEHVVAKHFENLGYKVELTSYTNDYGVDAIAIKDNCKIAVQAKMFGNTSRKINRQMVMELHGVKDFFNCDKAIIATDGEVIDNAMEVAIKLSIEIINIPAQHVTNNNTGNLRKTGKFENFWEEYIIPLEGKTLYKDNGKTNIIIKVDWSGIERITSNNRKQKIKIEIFKKTVLHLFRDGSISRKYINQEYLGRASSGIVLILSNTPIFEKTINPMGLKLKKG